MKEQRTSQRSVSASEVARNVKHFETWSLLQGCEQVDFSDLPTDLRTDVLKVFDVEGKLPYSWVDPSSDASRVIQELGPETRDFLLKAYESSPSLFSKEAGRKIGLRELSTVVTAWMSLQKMKRRKERWSERRYAANVYDPFRNPAVRESSHWPQCTLCLPQHVAKGPLTRDERRVLKPRTVVPDGALFLWSPTVKKRSYALPSAYKIIANHTSTKRVCGRGNDSSFKSQATPCAASSEGVGFEFISCVWEDKKPSLAHFDQAYRQNRMSAAASLRHLHSLRIQAPAFGLLWADGIVRAHVDWCQYQEGEQLAVFSAPYPGVDVSDDNGDIFQEWDLSKPGDILKVYLLIQNLDIWTAGRFRERVESGVQTLVTSIVDHGKRYKPWKKEVLKATPIKTDENSIVESSASATTNSMSSTLTSPTPVHRPKQKTGKSRFKKT